MGGVFIDFTRQVEVRLSVDRDLIEDEGDSEALAINLGNAVIRQARKLIAAES